MIKVYSYCIFTFIRYFYNIHGLFNSKLLVKISMPSYGIVLMGKYDHFTIVFRNGLWSKAKIIVL